MKIYTTYCGPTDPEVTKLLKRGEWQALIPVDKNPDPKVVANLEVGFDSKEMAEQFKDWGF